ncbi:hypothetical protein DSM106972_098370 [Dulcicalothrix desertica PCC 7102]|uniref:Prepilin-type N-terminal cleavage/methylation domain-containing protein n=1 Tax=Dulcicalothrix desertica PCC 7102 TaxID=232991 RepID=A0A3S1A3E0_9CYAN|nr:hormogonium polysaccharide secretion pseudopilin HpsC [Dulcicalothrix desertica]RUS92689.1 hypothetical protein DSM106972_098370 [Dulcicalothrix desertica PCC 7102]TWH49942.1 prepilin-type N-terminal cleavage/methylation domain-containing protein [Dulcicalothrix desertica PCC 7102]
MRTLLTYFFKTRIKSSVPQQGFTLIELLVAMVMAVLVITPLLGFMVNILDTDRKEQAKTNSEQEIQSALDYISQDLEQAIYIYDADGIYGKSADGINGILSQLPSTPAGKTQVPVLVFWKRYFLDKNENVKVGTTDVRAGCLVKLPLPGNPCSDQDYQLYSLVVYYLVQGGSSTWNSTTARIERWEIRHGIRDVTGTLTRSETVNGTTRTVNYLTLPDSGFMPFNLDLEGNLKKKLGNWTKHSDAYNISPTALVDYIDQSTQNLPPSQSCNADEQQVPRYTESSVPATLKTYSFYACVNSQNYIARVFIRGNALAKFQNGGTYSANNAQYFPTATVQIKGRGFLGIE